MTGDNTTQTVANGTEGAATQAPAVDNGAQGDELEALLAQFEQEVTKPSATATQPTQAAQPKPTEQKPNDISALTAKVQSLVERDEAREAAIRKQKIDQDLMATVKSVRGDIPETVISDLVVKGWLNAASESDPRLVDAFNNREQNPARWNQVVAQLGKKLRSEFSRLPDVAETEDREAVTAAVRGASTKPPPAKAPDFKSMTNQDFANDVEKKYGFRPLV
jgi:hypothetical protein